MTLGEAGGWNWDDKRKIDTLRPCLLDYLKRKLQEHDVSGITPTKYLDFVSLCKRYASQSSVSFSAPVSAPNQPRQLYDHKADKMDLSTINVIGAIDSVPFDSGSRPSSCSSTNRSHCHRCRAIDHYVSVCPLQPRPSSGSPPSPISKGRPGRKQTGKRQARKKLE